MNEKLTVTELVEGLAAGTSWSKKFSRQFIREFTDIIIAGLERDGMVRIRGLGLFRLRQVEERMGRNPQTGEPLLIPAHQKVQFVPEKSLRELVNRRYAHLKPVLLKEGPAPKTLEAPLPVPLASPPSSTRQKTDRKKMPTFAWLLLVLLLAIPVIWFLLRSPEPSQAPVTKVKIVEPSQVVEPKVVKKDPAPVAASASGSIHEVHPGETLWRVAGTYYQEPFFWPLVYFSNRGELTDPDLVETGQRLSLQPLVGTREHLAAEDSVALGRAFEAVYEIYHKKAKSDADSYRRVSRLFTGAAVN